MEHLNVAGRRIGPGEPPWIVAEIGANHNGDMGLCRALLEAAHAAGADAVKFQSWSVDSLVSRAEFARHAGGNGDSLEDQVRRFQLTPAQHREVAAWCRDLGIVWFSSCFSGEEVALLERLDVPAYKVASMDVNNLPLLRQVAATGRPVFLATGMATLGEVERAVDTLRAGGSGAIALLHCVALYPAPPERIRLRTMATWARAFDLPVGFSDHTLGVAVPLAAAALGACAIEKHFTTDRALPGWDHAVSADPEEFRALVDGARAAFAALGDEARVVAPEELEKRTAFRRRMVARRALRAGERLVAADVAFKRPGTGIGPDQLEYAVGRRLSRDVAPEDEIEWADFE